MSQCGQAITKTPSEIIEEICAIIGVGFSESQARRALSLATREWGAAVRPCFCRILDDSVRCGQCEYDLFCCGVTDDITPYIRRKRCGCGKSDCWHRLECYDIRCGKLVTEGNIEGDIRVEYRVPQPPIKQDDLELISPYKRGDGVVWIRGRVENLPPAGYLKVCEHWTSYQCWAQVEIEEGAGLFDIRQSEAWLNPEKTISEDIISRQPILDEASGETIEEGLEPGVHTVLYDAESTCNSIQSDSYYPAGSLVEFGLAANCQSEFSYLVDLALYKSFQMRLTSCNTPAERDTAAYMLDFYKDQLAVSSLSVNQTIDVVDRGDTFFNSALNYGRLESYQRGGYHSGGVSACC